MPVIKSISAFVCLGALFGLAGCGPNYVKPKDRAAVKATADVRAAVAEIVAGYAARDVAPVVSVNALDHMAMFHGMANTVGPDAELAAVKGQLADPAVKQGGSDEAIEVSRSGDLAVYRATYHFTYTNPETGKPANENGNGVAVSKRQPGGTMKMISEVVSDTPPAA